MGKNQKYLVFTFGLVKKLQFDKWREGKDSVRKTCALMKVSNGRCEL